MWLCQIAVRLGIKTGADKEGIAKALKRANRAKQRIKNIDNANKEKGEGNER